MIKAITLKLRTDPAACLAFAWLTIAIALQVDNGHYQPIALGLMLLGTGLVLIAAQGRLDHEQVSMPQMTERPLLPIILFVALIVGLTRPPGNYMHGSWYSTLYAMTTAAYAIPVGLVAFAPKRFGWLAQPVFIGGLILGFSMRILMPIASPTPIIDVFTMFQESAQHLLAGQNPYDTQVSDVYGGHANFGYKIFGYAYLPANLYFQTAAYALFGDIRYANIAAEALAVWALLKLDLQRTRARWLALMLLFMPRGLYTIELAWTEPLLVGMYGVIAVLAAEKPGSRRLAVVYGLMLSLKQYLIFFMLHGLLLERRWKRIMLAALVGLATIIPFLLLDAHNFFRYGLLFQLTTAFRSDGLTISSAFYQLSGMTVGKSISALVGFVVAIVTFIKYQPLGAEGWRWMTLVTSLFIFLFGSQAFCNYYYWIEAMLLFVLAGIPD